MDLDVNGRRVFAATGGIDFDPALPAIVFIHGGSLDRTQWKLQTRYFAWHGHGVLALDLPGHGRSEGPLLASIADMAAWLLDLLEAAGVARAALVGHSMGALVALDAAARAPERVSALSLLGAAFPMAVTDLLLEPAKANDHLALDRFIAWCYGPEASMGGNVMPGMWLAGGGMRVVERSGDGVLYADLMACRDYADGAASAAKVACPVQFVLAEKDIMTPLKHARAFAETFPTPPRIDVLAGAGHMMMEEVPDATLDALRAFLEG